jgi:regulator of sigma E protease
MEIFGIDLSFGLNLDWVIPFVVILTVLVFVHEMGHYLIARRNGVRVEVFSIGFGPEIWGRTDSHGTRWKVSWIPLGGYVKMFGEQDFDGGEGEETPLPMTEEDQKVSFNSKRLGQRAAIVFAGPAANYVFAIVVFFFLFALVGEPRLLAGVGSVDENSAAAAAGIRPGDRIVRVGGQDVHWFEDLRDVISANPGKKLSLTLLRDGAKHVISVTPGVRKAELPNGEVKDFGLLGVRPDTEQFQYEDRGPLASTKLALERTWTFSARILGVVGGIFSGSHSSKELGGPLRIAQYSGQVAESGWINLIHFTAILSINLGLINLFPIPLLDGGHLAFYVIEAVRGRPLGQKAQEIGLKFGLALVIGVFLFVTWNDLVQLKFFEFIKGLFT